uniref:Uncharacterized protein n=1 Tax=Rhizophagus irregularis (strain DAOM 181602 / DAOM 197198 / MUCL 43194) TaxID=747089 RepID=U9TAX9_RHIID
MYMKNCVYMKNCEVTFARHRWSYISFNAGQSCRENVLSGNRLSGNRLSENRLSGNRLSGNRGVTYSLYSGNDHHSHDKEYDMYMGPKIQRHEDAFQEWEDYWINKSYDTMIHISKRG